MEWILNNLEQLQNFLQFLTGNFRAMVYLLILIGAYLLYRYLQIRAAKADEGRKSSDASAGQREETGIPAATEEANPVADTAGVEAEKDISAAAVLTEEPEEGGCPVPAPVTEVLTPPQMRFAAAPGSAIASGSDESPSGTHTAPPSPDGAVTVNNSVTIGGRGNRVGNITQGGKIHDK